MTGDHLARALALLAMVKGHLSSTPTGNVGRSIVEKIDELNRDIALEGSPEGSH